MAQNGRSYGQYCGLAHALDLVGERWQMLVVRELAFGSLRFTDLLAGLPGMSRTVLASRLRSLERSGVVRRGVLPPPAASAVYELTDYGRDLGPILLGLCRWGVRSLAPRAEEPLHSNWLALALKAHFRPDAADEVRRVYELRLRDGPFRLEVADRTVATAKGPAEGADLVLEADDDALVGLLAGRMSPEAALAGGAVAVVSGDAAELRLFLELFRFADPVAA
jgi:DNA-binding HxlR family transcriptional regulator/putative sterol carrier protein